MLLTIACPFHYLFVYLLPIIILFWILSLWYSFLLFMLPQHFFFFFASELTFFEGLLNPCSVLLHNFIPQIALCYNYHATHYSVGETEIQKSEHASGPPPREWWSWNSNPGFLYNLQISSEPHGELHSRSKYGVYSALS